ncbi:hypothetical protein GC105_10750 [Alkalibaculum sp. M08DMB]|uniref:Prophage tail endopeptidase domain-containing protein n=1 Tax=Alkalibaculum sporogenes TaxID=2655001 RepID=A0A6A7KA49_9FIRM|nr:phage tail spike protein [Alkalibaculum sporogenes]MPW26266.1 hypothetical protein [Alkalibaculum sporogenes]
MILVKNKTLNNIGILENAYDQSVKRTVNELWQASFSLPKSDPKNELCSHLNFIDITGDSGRYYGLYRIMPTSTTKNESTDSITYTCEHVLATLLDDVMDGYHQYTNYTTRQVLEYILSLQEAPHWVLGQVDFTRYFHYSFENENGLLAPLLSIPKPFNEAYEFTFDTQVYPWVLNLKSVSDKVKSEIRWGKDMIDFSEVSDPTDIVNYIIPKGSGEGVNQVTIASVNGGLKYLKDDESIAKWGKMSYIWIDQRFEDAESLKANAQSLLDQWKEPKVSFEIDSADLSIKPEYSHERKVLNGITRIIVEDKEYLARIVGDNIADLSREFEVKYQINNKLDDIATTQADLERKQQVNEAYSQGATNIMNFGYQDNCDSDHPAILPIYVDDDVVNINTCELTFRTKKFRAYSKSIEGGGATVKSTSAGGGTNTSTESGGGATETTTVKNFTSLTLVSDIPSVPDYNTHKHESILYGDRIEHDHNVIIPSHSHNFTVATHSHEFTLEDHTHGILYGIYELDELPEIVTVKVDGNTVTINSTSENRLNLIDYLDKDSNGKVTRGRHEVEILPSDLARIEADVILRVFIQSRLGGNY